ncbi:MAG TPA: Hsp20/alpha crystallin family protein [Polyangiaceae bacterium]|jgi:HSP20 family molecular chaperone IbpA|nr:Hsp20/alpha crystallin family protein [Polyangiaceae bacterium]
MTKESLSRDDLSSDARVRSDARGPEQTRPGEVYSPATDIFETDEAITVLADMPGVKADALQIDLRDNVLTLTGRVARPESGYESELLREYQVGTFYRQFTLSERIDQAKIDAKLRDGVLRLELPKIERAKPRTIQVRTG